jgi:hypothetical protein
VAAGGRASPDCASHPSFQGPDLGDLWTLFPNLEQSDENPRIIPDLQSNPVKFAAKAEDLQT